MRKLEYDPAAEKKGKLVPKPEVVEKYFAVESIRDVQMFIETALDFQNLQIPKVER